MIGQLSGPYIFIIKNYWYMYMIVIKICFHHAWIVLLLNVLFSSIYIFLAHIKNVITSKEDQILNCSACLEYNESGFSGKCSKLCLSYIIKERVNKD